MIKDLYDFLNARFDEDEITARGAHAGPWNHHSSATGEIEIYQGGIMPEGPFGDVISVSVRPNRGYGRNRSREDLPYGNGREHTADHIVRWNPGRALADLQAKRNILKNVFAMASSKASKESLLLAESILIDLAQPYAFSQGFDYRWMR